tara:strand:- start:811 stop:969 length:159 start_codon:yes stop_codon:yes gene_type:complete
MHLFFLLLLFYRYHYSPILVAFAERIFSGETHYFAQNLLALQKCSTSTLGDV